jgi:hypothetical protein
MAVSIIQNRSLPTQKSFLISLAMVIPALLFSCSARYGSLKLDPQAQEEFESNRVPTEYKYYYYGFSSEPYVVFGIEPDYVVNSRMWREAAPDTEEFKEMIRWIWADYGYQKFGADILDPTGKKVGILYSAISQISVKFMDDNQIVVMPNSPFLWGPDGGNDWSP